MMRRWMLALALPLAMWSCADDAPTQEPVGADAPPAVPDAPGAAGDAGTTAERPAGEGSADGAAPSAQGAAPMTETATEPPAAAPAASGAGTMTVTAAGLNVRSGPGTKHKAVRVLKRGDKVNVGTCQGIWCQIGAGEFVSKKHLSAAP